MSKDKEKSGEPGDLEQKGLLQELLAKLPPKGQEEVEQPEETETPEDAYMEPARPTIFAKRDKPEHPKQDLQHNGEAIPIDVQLVPLIQRIWGQGWETLNSCYNSSNYHLAYIHFATAQQARQFFDLVEAHVSFVVWDRRGNEGVAIRFPTAKIEEVTALLPEPPAAGG